MHKCCIRVLAQWKWRRSAPETIEMCAWTISENVGCARGIELEDLGFRDKTKNTVQIMADSLAED